MSIFKADGPNRLGLLARIAVVLLALNVAGGMARTLFILLGPLMEAGQIGTEVTYGAAALMGLMVFAAALLAIAWLARSGRWHGFWLFWFLAFLISYGLAIGPLTLAEDMINSMGQDYLPLAWAVVGGFSLVAAGLSVLVIVKLLVRKAQAPSENDGSGSPFMTVAVTLFVSYFLMVGFEAMLGWPPVAAAPAGLLVVSMVARVFRAQEISWLFIVPVSLAIAVVVTEMPPSNLVVLTIVVFTAALALLASGVSRLMRRTRTTALSAVNILLLSLVLLAAPTGPSPAHWLADKLGHPGRPVADFVMVAYADAYEVPRWHAVLALIDGFRSGAATVRPMSLDRDDARHALMMLVEIHNTGEQGIGRMTVGFLQADAATGACAVPEVALNFDQQPLWPGDRRGVVAEWHANAECKGDDWLKLADGVRAYLFNRSSYSGINNSVQETRPFDRVALFEKEAADWLGL